MSDYTRLFVSVNPNGCVFARGGKRPSKYYQGVRSWNGEAVNVGAGRWRVDCGDGREFTIEQPPHSAGNWKYLGIMTDPPPKNGDQIIADREQGKTTTKPEPNPKGVTLEELLAEDEAT
jgi:hypothetical protein